MLDKIKEQANEVATQIVLLQRNINELKLDFTELRSRLEAFEAQLKGDKDND